MPLLLSWEPAGGCGCAPALAAALLPADGGGGWGAACLAVGIQYSVVLLQEAPCKRLSVQRGGASHVLGSLMSLPGSQTC